MFASCSGANHLANVGRRLSSISYNGDGRTSVTVDMSTESESESWSRCTCSSDCKSRCGSFKHGGYAIALVRAYPGSLSHVIQGHYAGDGGGEGAPACSHLPSPTLQPRTCRYRLEGQYYCAQQTLSNSA